MSTIMNVGQSVNLVPPGRQLVAGMAPLIVVFMQIFGVRTFFRSRRRRRLPVATNEWDGTGSSVGLFMVFYESLADNSTANLPPNRPRFSSLSGHLLTNRHQEVLNQRLRIGV